MLYRTLQTEEYWGNVNPIGERSCYDEGKRAAECLTMDYHREHGQEVGGCAVVGVGCAALVSLCLFGGRGLLHVVLVLPVWQVAVPCPALHCPALPCPKAHMLPPQATTQTAHPSSTPLHTPTPTQVRIVRIFNTYGPRMALDDGRVVSNFVSQVTAVCVCV